MKVYNIHIENSYAVSKKDFNKVLADREWEAYEHNIESEIGVFQNRSQFSLKCEWACHNFLYALNIARERTKDVDLDYPQKWYLRIAYTVGGVLVWLFIK